MKKLTQTIICISFLTLLLGANLNEAQAIAKLPYKNKKLYRCVIGESASEGSKGMIAVAEAIRNRGTTKGVYGCNAKFVDNEPQWVWDKARKAWELSEHTNVTEGATHWENLKEFGKPWWADSLTKTVKIGNHQFYKED